MSSPSAQSGNVLFYILICVALFAALSYAFTRGGSSGADKISEDKARLIATEILSQGENLATAVKKLRLRGISEERLSFENPVVSGYENTACTVDECKIFQLTGGGISFPTPPSESQTSLQNWGFTATKAIVQAGTAERDLIAIFPNLKKEVCEKINSQLGISSAYPQGATTLNKFVGSYTGLAGVMGITDNKLSGCVVYTSLGGSIIGSTTSNNYVFIQTLIPR